MIKEAIRRASIASLAIMTALFTAFVPFTSAYSETGVGDGSVTIEAQSGEFSIYRLINGEVVDGSAVKNYTFDFESTPLEFWQALEASERFAAIDDEREDENGDTPFTDTDTPSNDDITSEDEEGAPESGDITGNSSDDEDNQRVIYADLSTPEAVEKYLVAENDADSDKLTVRLARLAAEYGTPIAVIGANETVEVPNGYYLVTSDQTHPVLVMVENGENITIVTKHSTPTIEKTIIAGENGASVPYTSMKVGDDIAFKLTGTLPSNFNSFDEYHYMFSDTHSSTLDVEVASVKVFLVDEDEDRNIDITSAASIDYDTPSRTLTVLFENMKQSVPQALPTDKVVVDYVGRLNSSISSGLNDPAYNDASITFTTVPTQDGVTKIWGVADDAVHVYTFSLEVNKTGSDTHEALAGADFAIQSDDGRFLSSDGYWTDGRIEDNLFTTDYFGQISFNGLSDGTYTLYEVNAPTGYDPIAEPIVVELIDDSDGSNPVLTANIISGSASLSSVDMNTGLVSVDIEDPAQPLLFTGLLDKLLETGFGLPLAAVALVAIAVVVFIIIRRINRR